MPETTTDFHAEPELIVIMPTDAVAPPGGALAGGMAGLDALLADEGAVMHSLFSVALDQDQPGAAPPALTAHDAAGAPSTATVYRVEVEAHKMERVAQKLRDTRVPEAVYIKPPASPAVIRHVAPPAAGPPAATTPDFSANQGYLNAAPEGVDARFAWTKPGGDGAGIKVIDVEGEWQHTHEDLNIGPAPITGTPQNDLGWRNHGTAVTGVVGAKDDGRGVTGIAHGASVHCVSIFGGGRGSAVAIRDAADNLRAGDILLIELHRPGPRHNFDFRPDQAGFVAVEWWPDDYLAVRYATGKGILVVEAAGNGAEDLDDTIYDTNPSFPQGPFPAWWQNPYRRAPLDSGAIVVGAGAPPPGTHGSNHGPDRSRLGFSNYGALTDAQGWGEEVTTTGYGDLQSGPEDRWYTDTFNGTSSASPVVVGALACMQGALSAAGRTLLTPATARTLLRNTGSPQRPRPGAPVTQRIGSRPDLRAMLASVGLAPAAPPAEAERERTRPRPRPVAAKPKKKAARKKPAMPKAKPAKAKPKRAMARKTSAPRKNNKAKPVKSAKKTKVAKQAKVAKKKPAVKKKPARPAARKTKPARKKR